MCSSASHEFDAVFPLPAFLSMLIIPGGSGIRDLAEIYEKHGEQAIQIRLIASD